MADAQNPGQFGKRPDTGTQASKGGQQSGHNQPDQGTQQSDEDMDMMEDLT